MIDYIFHVTCVMPIPDKTFQTSYVLTLKKTNSKKPKFRNLLSINTRNHENIAKCAQNVHREP